MKSQVTVLNLFPPGQREQVPLTEMIWSQAFIYKWGLVNKQRYKKNNLKWWEINPGRGHSWNPVMCRYSKMKKKSILFVLRSNHVESLHSTADGIQWRYRNTLKVTKGTILKSMLFPCSKSSLWFFIVRYWTQINEGEKCTRGFNVTKWEIND